MHRSVGGHWARPAYAALVRPPWQCCTAAAAAKHWRSAATATPPRAIALGCAAGNTAAGSVWRAAGQREGAERVIHTDVGAHPDALGDGTPSCARARTSCGPSRPRPPVVVPAAASHKRRRGQSRVVGAAAATPVARRRRDARARCGGVGMGSAAKT